MSGSESASPLVKPAEREGRNVEEVTGSRFRLDDFSTGAAARDALLLETLSDLTMALANPSSSFPASSSSEECPSSSTGDLAEGPASEPLTEPDSHPAASAAMPCSSSSVSCWSGRTRTSPSDSASDSEASSSSLAGACETRAAPFACDFVFVFGAAFASPRLTSRAPSSPTIHPTADLTDAATSFELHSRFSTLLTRAGVALVDALDSGFGGLKRATMGSGSEVCLYCGCFESLRRRCEAMIGSRGTCCRVSRSHSNGEIIYREQPPLCLQITDIFAGVGFASTAYQLLCRSEWTTRPKKFDLLDQALDFLPSSLLEQRMQGFQRSRNPLLGRYRLLRRAWLCRLLVLLRLYVGCV